MQPAPSAPLPAHVPPSLVRDYPLVLGGMTLENPFDRIVPEIAAGPEVLYATNVYPGGGPGWVFRRAEDLKTIYRDTEHFSSKGFSPFSMLIGESWSQIPAETDPPEHAGYRAMINPLLAPGTIAKLDAKVRAYAQGYIAEFKDKGSCDFMADFAFKFPIAVFLELMGLPQEDVDQLLAWEMDLLHQPDMAKVAAAVLAVKAYLLAKLDERRVEPRDDFLTYAITTTIDGRPLNEDELIGMTFGLYIGGLDTVSTNMGLHFRHLAEHPKDQALLRANPDKIVLATEELLRAYAAVTTFRTCKSQVVVNGVTLMPGDKVAMCTTLAGRDGEKYDAPNEVRLDRGPNHESFANGPHRCVGMHLARRELHVGMEEFLKAIPAFRIAPDAQIMSSLGLMIQPMTLPLVWDI